MLKHSFIGWLAMKKRLQTKDRLHALGISQSEQCLIYNNEEESSHLFFNCSFSMQVLQEVKRWLGICTTTNTLPHILTWIKRRSKGGKFKKQVSKANILATVYNIWQERNNALWNAQIHTVQKVVLEIKSTVKKKRKLEFILRLGML